MDRINNVLNSNIEDIRLLKSTVFDLRLKYDDIDDESLRSEIKGIIQIGDKVYAELVRNNSKTPSAYKFISFYLPTIDKILGKYILLVRNRIKSRDSLQLRADILQNMPKFREALNRYYESMFTAEIGDVDVDMEVLLRQL